MELRRHQLVFLLHSLLIFGCIECAPRHFKFTKPQYNASIPENSAGKAFVTAEEKMGIYRGDEDIEIRYKIVSGDKEKFFKAEERLVGDFWFLLLRTRTGNIDVLNRERKERYTLEIKATATKRDGKKAYYAEAETVVVVTILDVNDLNPLFYPTEYEEIVPEDMPLHQSILRVSAEDADLGRNGEIYYSFQESSKQFAIHPTTGIVTLTRPLRHTEKPIHELTVLARDRGAVFKGGGKPSTAKLKIIVKPVNLYAPEISIQHLPDIVENSNTDVYAIVKVTDPDEGIHGFIRSLDIVDGDPDGHFRVKQYGTAAPQISEFTIEVLKLLDREIAPRGYNLTLRAVDRGIPPRQTYKSVPVNLVDQNDNAPIFDREIYEVDIPETAPINSPIIRLKVTDADQGKNAQTYLEIVGGNEGDEFRINPDTGMLYTNVLVDAEVKSFYTLTVTAIDQGNTGTRKQSSAKVKINVVDTNDNDPLFETSDLEVEISENSPAGTSVTKMIAKDKDSGENSYISYSIANLNSVPFEIDHFTGVVKTTQILDYESMRRQYVLRIRASDWGFPFRRQTETQLKIRLKDINDNRPQFEKIDCVGYISRFLPIGTEIITLSAIDFDAGNIISYRIVSGNEDGCFSLDTTSGVISVTCDLSDVAVEDRELNVTATDGTHFADVVRVAVKLMNKRTSSPPGRILADDSGTFDCKDTGVAKKLTDILAESERSNSIEKGEREEFAMMPSRYGENVHSPEFVNFPSSIQVNESIGIGETLLRIKATDRDRGYNGKLIFGISSGDIDSVFRLDPNSGEIKVIGYLDRERETQYLLNITVYDQGKPQKSNSKLLPITVLDVNDNAPKFKVPLASFRVTENAHNKTDIFRVNATDLDEGENAHVEYHLLTDTDEFRVDPATGILYVSAPLDREKQELYELVVRAIDCAGTPGSINALFSDAIIRVIVDDVNDNTPAFSLPSYSVKAREDIPEGSVIAVISASDPDLGSGGDIRYVLIPETEDDDTFEIDELTGTIRIVKPLDFEDRQVHSLIVRAEDRGTPPLSSEVTLLVEVVDVNENLNPPVFHDFVVAASVHENQPVGTFVIKVKAIDDDPADSDDSRVGYSIKSGDGLGYFSIDNEGNIRTLSVLDTEAKGHYWLTVVAQDHGVVPLYTTLQVFIAVTNVNDNIPLTLEPIYYPRVKENSAVGTPVLQLSATDPDSRTVTYRITSGNPESVFTIDYQTGLITTTGRKLDRENQAEHILEITISDDGTPPLSSTTQVIVTVEDVNDNTPIFEESFYHFIIPETRHQESPLTHNWSGESDLGSESLLTNGTWESFPINDTGDPLFRVIAVDLDEKENGEVFYEIMSGRGKGKFGIHPKTGMVYSQRSFHSGQEYDLFVRATDYGSPNRSSTSRVSVQVVDLPEDSKHAPVVKNPNQNAQVHESDGIGFLVALIQCEDEDGDSLWYSIKDGDPRSEFVISPDKGSVLLARQLDWELQNFYNLTISITDGIYVVHTQLYVSIVDINEHRPEFSKPIYFANITENAIVGTEIIKLKAIDKDKDSKVVYSLHCSQNPSSLHLFKVDYLTGSITIAQALDREALSEHILTVMVKDHGTPAKRNFARVLIEVHDANDHAPEFSQSLIQGRVFETSPIGTKILTLNAFDKDHGDNAKITYTISSGNVGNAFTLDPLLGTLHIARELDLNSMTEYMLNIKAKDSGNPSLMGNVPVHIMVVMADNAPPRFIRREIAAEVYENEAPGVPIKNLEARSTSSLSYELVRGNIDNVFNINPTTGAVYTNAPLDYEKTRVYNLSVTATNMAGAKAVCHVVIHVLDRNDNPPSFVEVNYKGWVNEDAPIGSLVLSNQSSPLVLKATDKDSQLNALLQYDIIEPGPRRIFHIDSTTGAIRTIVSLNFETKQEYEFYVRVTDLGKPRLSSENLAKVKISIIDVNDCAPVFSHSVYNASVITPTYPNIAVAKLSAIDQDSANFTQLTYSIISGNTNGIYSINSLTGIITIKEPSHQVGSSPHRLKVSVSDGKYSDEAIVNIWWTHSQDSGLIFQRPIYQGAVLENSTKVITVAVVTVLGSHLNEHLDFSILNPSPLFSIGATTGVIRTTGLRFDRESQENYQLIVQVRSEESIENEVRVAHVPVNVTVLDINDNCPMFVNLPYYAVVSIDAIKGDVITKVHAIDLDKGENGVVRYELVRGHGELFKVCRKTGEITLKQALEGHNREYQLIIGAYDGGNTPCSTEVPVNVKVMDRSMPVFDHQFYTVTTPENVELHTPLSVNIQAESPLGRKLIYAIVSGDMYDKFSVDFNTGGLYVVDNLDYETQREYALTVRATDSVSGVFADVLVSLLVTDINDCPPEFSVDSYNISISEASPFGSVILKVHAQDNDTGLNGKIQYSIEKFGNSDPDYFHIDSDDGSIYLKQSLDHETQTLHHLVVIATDEGVPSLSSSVHVWITVLDMNDNPPKLEKNVYSCWLSEEATRNQFVTIVTASDPDSVDHRHLSYSIVGGNHQQTFSMDSSTGIITLTNLHKLTETKAHTLNVSVSDGIYTSFARVRVEMISANKYSPVFDKHQYEAKISENLPSGTRVCKVHAIDKDNGNYGIPSYYISSQVLLEKFMIDNFTGEIYTKQILDREVKKLYEIPIVAIDAGGKLGFTSVRVWVTDINDSVPKFLLPEYKASIPSNLSVNSGFLKVKATDKDEDISAQIEYSLYDKGSRGVRDLFHINKNTGGLSLLKSAIPYETQVFQFFIRATDRGIPTLHADVPIDIYIMASNDMPPIFERRDDKFFVAENADAGTVITRVKLVSDMSVKFKLLSGNDIFSIDANGEITLTGKLDREKYPSYILGVLAYTDSSPPLTAFTEISLQILDHNDNKPLFQNENYIVSVAENIEEGSSIVKVHASDADEGTNGEVRYGITGPGTETFAIDAHTGWVTTLIPLDKETIPNYKLNIIATDGGIPPKSSNVSLYVNLVDYNDNPPVFTQESYTASVNEDALPGTVVVQIFVTDKDSEANNVEFHIIAGDPHTQFDVRLTGEVYVARPLDRETMDKYELTVLATDGKFVAVAALYIDVLDVNDQEPFCLRYRYKETISEGVPVGSFILTVFAVDLDLESKLRFYLTGDGSENFSIDRTTGELKSARLLDRERKAHYSLIAHVQDREHTEWECVSFIEIFLSDVNDNPPVFPSFNFTASIQEDAPIGTIVTKMHATDDDIGVNRKVRYFLINSADRYFKMDAESGIITLAKTLDRETQETYNLTVKAVDQGLPQLWSHAAVTVQVLDVNDNPPEFVTRSYHTSIIESATIGSEVIRVTATSLDSGLNAEIEYSIVGGNEHGKFAIDKKSGAITIMIPLDYERAHEFLLTVQGTDLGIPPLSSQATVNITVLDSNDNAPSFSEISYSAEISEDCNVGDVVTQVLATDLDTDMNGKIIYTIERGDKHQQFSINKDTGLVTVARPLDREMIATYTLQIRAADRGIPEMSSFTALNIEVIDANDNPPLFTQSNYTVIVQEDKRPGWAVCQLLVTDSDIPPNTGPFIFDLQSGPGRASFRIEPDGTLRTAALLNYKIQDTYLLHVRVFDNGSPPLYSDTWVIVKVIEESQFPPSVTPLNIWIGSYQERWNGGEIGRIHTTDQDQYDTLNFAIASSYPKSHSLFSIDPHNGVLTASPGLDPGRYSLNISVSDGKFLSYGSIKITVEPLWDEMLQNAYSIRIPGMTPHTFILTQRKTLLKGLKSMLMREISVLSVQEVNSGDIDALVHVKDGIEIEDLNEALKSINLPSLQLDCKCLNGAICRQRVNFDSERILMISTDFNSFVAPSHTHDTYCACNFGYTGDKCEELLPPTQCECPPSQTCIPQPGPPGFVCAPPSPASPLCSLNHTCPPIYNPTFSGLYSFTWMQIMIGASVASLIFLLCFICFLCRRCKERPIDEELDKNIPVLNSDMKRSSKLSNLEVTQCTPRPASYTSGSNNEVYTGPLNNLDTVRSYGSAGDELENVPPDYVKNLNRNSSSPGHKINNDLKRMPEIAPRGVRKTLSCVEEDARILGGYHWDCSDWVRPNQNPLPNITEVPGSEVPDSSSFHSNESNDSISHHQQAHAALIDPARDLATLDEELYLTYHRDRKSVV